jgi:hypothetical protein
MSDALTRLQAVSNNDLIKSPAIIKRLSEIVKPSYDPVTEYLGDPILTIDLSIDPKKSERLGKKD